MPDDRDRVGLTERKERKMQLRVLQAIRKQHAVLQHDTRRVETRIYVFVVHGG